MVLIWWYSGTNMVVQWYLGTPLLTLQTVYSLQLFMADPSNTRPPSFMSLPPSCPSLPHVPPSLMSLPHSCHSLTHVTPSLTSLHHSCHSLTHVTLSLLSLPPLMSLPHSCHSRTHVTPSLMSLLLLSPLLLLMMPPPLTACLLLPLLPLYAGAMSRNNEAVGTWSYLAPEYKTQGRSSTGTDVYAFGLSLLQLVTGAPQPRDLIRKCQRALELGALQQVRALELGALQQVRVGGGRCSR